MVEEASYIVRMTLTTNIDFSPIERDRSITRFDAIENAIGTLPDGWLDRVEDEGWSVDFEAERVT